MADLRNKVIGGFRIIDDLKLGSGAEGTVYKAVCETARFEGCPVGTVVALKTMTVQDDDHRLFARLEKRTDELVRLVHPNVVRYFGCFFEQSMLAELHVVVQEFLEGETLKERLLTHPEGLDVDEAIKVMKSVVAGLSAAAEKGIYHRDVKPANIFMCADGAVKLIDFEVARQEGGTTSTGGAMIGTFDYMSPDFTDPSFRGDEQSDIFSAGVVMHEAITGRTPYQKLGGGKTQANFAFLSRWARNENGEYATNPISISLKVRRLLSHCNEVLEAALSPDRSKRFAHFSDFVLALGKIHYRELRNPTGRSTYLLLQIVGRGGFGEVFKVRERKTGRLAAVKHLLKGGYAERFRREAKVMAKLVDPCFVRFIEFFETPDAGAFIVMDFLDGMPGNSLRDAIRRAKGVGLDRKDVLSAFVRYAHGLALMHAGGADRDPIFHRDIKPANLYFPERRIENAALMDFGIAKDTGGTMTVAGTVPGTLDYMPPEIVLMESRGDAGVDVYALGLCLYEALSGKMAYPRVRDDKSGTIEFMSRATKKLKPNFGDPSVKSNPEILALLTEMTDPDTSRRLTDAREVELRLAKLAGVDPLPMEENPDHAARKAVERASPQGDGESATCATRVMPLAADDGVTCGTVELPPDGFQEALRREKRRLLARRLLRFGLPLGLIAAAVLSFFFVPQVRMFVEETVARPSDPSEDSPAQPAGEGVAEKHPTEDEKVLVEEKRQDEEKHLDEEKRLIEERNRLLEEKKRLDEEKKKLDEEKRRLKEEAEKQRLEEEAEKQRLEEEAEKKRLEDEAEKKRLDEEKKRLEEEANKKKSLAEAKLERQRKIDAIQAALENFFKAEPIAERRKRLDECEKALAAQETTALLSASERTEYARRLTAERVRVVGKVKNLSTLNFRIGEGQEAQDVPAKASVMLDFPKGLPPGASLTSAGYEPIRLTWEEFDGKVFTVVEDQPIPEAVAVTLPQLEGDVSCLVDGQAFLSGRKIRPGTHEYRYRRADCLDQGDSFTVEIATPVTLPAPAGWKDAPALVKLGEAEAAEKKGEWERVEVLLAAADVAAPRNRERKEALAGRLEKHKEAEKGRIRFGRMLQEAKEYFSYGSWSDVLKTFVELRKSGYALTDADLKMCAEARDNGTKAIDQRIKNLKYWDKGGPKEDKMRAEIRQLNEWHRELTGE